MADALLSLFLLPFQLITLRDAAPAIGLIVLIVIGAVAIYIIYRLIVHWSEEATKEYAREHPEYPAPLGPS